MAGRGLPDVTDDGGRFITGLHAGSFSLPRRLRSSTIAAGHSKVGFTIQRQPLGVTALQQPQVQPAA